ncbi:hypothetical protein L484_027715 [Morus notabilis]|uniref:Uncharacterized protein n=1 Tax=Morus notabilis TaxID=981085 RepID=W9RCR6_9ROSA|nr:hypothetical protein L484_027715 [Morus notabilis]
MACTGHFISLGQSMSASAIRISPQMCTPSRTPLTIAEKQIMSTAESQCSFTTQAAFSHFPNLRIPFSLTCGSLLVLEDSHQR